VDLVSDANYQIAKLSKFVHILSTLFCCCFVDISWRAVLWLAVVMLFNFHFLQHF